MHCRMFDSLRSRTWIMKHSVFCWAMQVSPLVQTPFLHFANHLVKKFNLGPSAYFLSLYRTSVLPVIAKGQFNQFSCFFFAHFNAPRISSLRVVMRIRISPLTHCKNHSSEFYSLGQRNLHCFHSIFFQPNNNTLSHLMTLPSFCTYWL